MEGARALAPSSRRAGPASTRCARRASPSARRAPRRSRRSRCRGSPSRRRAARPGASARHGAALTGRYDLRRRQVEAPGQAVGLEASRRSPPSRRPSASPSPRPSAPRARERSTQLGLRELPLGEQRRPRRPRLGRARGPRAAARPCPSSRPRRPSSARSAFATTTRASSVDPAKSSRTASALVAGEVEPRRAGLARRRPTMPPSTKRPRARRLGDRARGRRRDRRSRRRRLPSNAPTARATSSAACGGQIERTTSLAARPPRRCHVLEPRGLGASRGLRAAPLGRPERRGARALAARRRRRRPSRPDAAGRPCAQPLHCHPNDRSVGRTTDGAARAGIPRVRPVRRPGRDRRLDARRVPGAAASSSSRCTATRS